MKIARLMASITTGSILTRIAAIGTYLQAQAESAGDATDGHGFGERLDALEKVEAPKPVDLTPLEKRLEAIEGAEAPEPVDLTPFTERLDALEALLGDPAKAAPAG